MTTLFPGINTQPVNYGGSRAVYIKYELVNVQVTSFDLTGSPDE